MRWPAPYHPGMNANVPYDKEWPGRDEQKDARLRRIRTWATGLLLAAAVVYALATAFGAWHPALAYVAAFSEAAMIGALADWFAVVALFRHPMRLKLPHTAILPRNKQRIAAGLSQFIQDNFLSAGAIVAKIAEVGPADKLREWLLARDNAGKVAAYASRLIGFLMGALDDARVREFLHGVLTAKLRELDLASAAAQLLDVLTEGKRHHAVLDEVLRLLDEALGRPQAREAIARAVVAESGLVNAVKKMGWDLDETIAAKIVSGVARTVEEVRNDPEHEMRRQFDAFIAHFVYRLKHDPATRARAEQLRDELALNPALATYVGALWGQFRRWLDADLADPESTVRASLAGMVRLLGEKMDPSIRAWIDEQILKSLPALVEENKARIGRFIEDTINGWHEEQFVKEMEREIGPDLQFIRINGTLVGGAAGLAIHAASRFLV